MFGGGFFGAGGPFGGGGGFPDMGGGGGPPRSDNTKFYKVLDVDRNASDAEIKKAHRKAALKHHPDKGRGQVGEGVARRGCARGGEMGAEGAGASGWRRKRGGAARWRLAPGRPTPATHLHAGAPATVHGAAIPGRSGDTGRLAPKLPSRDGSTRKQIKAHAASCTPPPPHRPHATRSDVN